MNDSSIGVWLTGERFDVAYFLDFASSRIRRFVTKGSEIGETGGVCHRLGVSHISWFVSPDNGHLMLRAGASLVPLDGTVPMMHTVGCGGIVSSLVIGVEGGSPFRISKLTPARAILRRFDPAYDELDESTDDFLADIADIASSAERREWILKTKDPTAGPWHLLGD